MKYAPYGLLVLALSMAFGYWSGSNKHHKLVEGNAKFYTVAYVYDGDTIKLDNGDRVRLIGIDSPEAHDNLKLDRDVQKRGIGREKQLHMGKQAGAYVRQFLKGSQVRLEYDVESHDRYGRVLAYVYLSDGTFVNEKIIRDGYAYMLTIPPNVRHAQLFQHAFEEAREQKRGLWQ